jgi:hypothetical protein
VVLTARVPDGPNPLWRNPLLQGKLIQRQSHHGDYACSIGGVAMSGDDGMDSSSQIPAVRCTWVPMAMSCHDRH